MRPEQYPIERLAQRLIWWQPPSEALKDPVRLISQVMALGTWEDVMLARQCWAPEDFRKVLQNAPPGVFDKRSWSYWHRMLGFSSIPPLPKRKLP